MADDIEPYRILYQLQRSPRATVQAMTWSQRVWRRLGMIEVTPRYHPRDRCPDPAACAVLTTLRRESGERPRDH